MSKPVRRVRSKSTPEQVGKANAEDSKSSSQAHTFKTLPQSHADKIGRRSHANRQMNALRKQADNAGSVVQTLLGKACAGAKGVSVGPLQQATLGGRC